MLCTPPGCSRQSPVSSPAQWSCLTVTLHPDSWQPKLPLSTVLPLVGSRLTVPQTPWLLPVSGSSAVPQLHVPSITPPSRDLVFSQATLLSKRLARRFPMDAAEVRLTCTDRVFPSDPLAQPPGEQEAWPLQAHPHPRPRSPAPPACPPLPADSRGPSPLGDGSHPRPPLDAARVNHSPLFIPPWRSTRLTLLSLLLPLSKQAEHPGDRLSSPMGKN